MNLHFVVDLSALIQFVLCNLAKLSKAVRPHIAHEILTAITPLGVNAIIRTITSVNITTIALTILIEG
jgi:hypothetical protein